MQKEKDSEFNTNWPIVSSLLDDVDHKILTPLSCLREFANHWLLELDLPLVSKKDVKITFNSNIVNIEAKLREKYSQEVFGTTTSFEFFKKSILLPSDIENQRPTVKFQKGRLEIKILKINTGQPIKII